MVVSTSEKEWMASEIMAPECPKMPAKILKPERAAFPMILTRDRFRMIRISWAVETVCLLSGIKDSSLCGDV